ncbi:MAG: DUF3305 domain-containing protein [Hyphomicrobiaceae bacterium]
MSVELTVPLGLVVARERIDHPWQEYRWRAHSVFLDAPAEASWRKIYSSAGTDHYHAATLPLVLHRKEAMSYRVNLANGEPSLYVVMREDSDGENGAPISVHSVTASPFEAQSYGNMAFEQVDRVGMPHRLVELVRAFVDEHHVEDNFKKRTRQPHVKQDEYQFGQEPIFVLRERMKSGFGQT